MGLIAFLQELDHRDNQLMLLTGALLVANPVSGPQTPQS